MKNHKNSIVIVSLITDDICDRIKPIIDYFNTKYSYINVCLYDVYKGKYDLREIVDELQLINLSVSVFKSVYEGIKLINNSKAKEQIFLVKHSQKNIHNLLLYFIYITIKSKSKLFLRANIILIRSHYIHRRNKIVGLKNDFLLILTKALIHYITYYVSEIICFLIIKPFIILLKSPAKNSKSFNKILFIRTDHIGDVICSLPALRALRESYPLSKITILCASWSSQPLKANPNLYDELMICDMPWLNRQTKFKWNIKAIYHLLLVVIEIRKVKYDLVIQPRGNELDILFAVITNGNSIVSAVNPKRPMSFLLSKYISNPIVFNPYKTFHISQWAELCLNEIGISVEVKHIRGCYNIYDFLEFEKEIYVWNSKGYRSCSIIIGAGNKAREWSSKKFAELIYMLYRMKIISIIIGSKSELRKRDEIFKHLDVPIVDMVDKTDFKNITSVLLHSDFVITLDTSIMHLASLLDKKIYAIFSSGNLNLAKPVFNENVTIIKKELGCSGCGDMCMFDHYPCIEFVNVNDVLKTIII